MRYLKVYNVDNMEKTELKFTKNKRLIEKDNISHVGGSIYGKEKLTRNEWEHQQDIKDAFKN